MTDNTMSPSAIELRRYYQNIGRWENLAKKTYGDDYEPPREDQVISDQALQLRREAGRRYHRNNKDMYAKAQKRYWERKAKILKGEDTE